MSQKTVWPNKAAASNALKLELNRAFARKMIFEFDDKACRAGRDNHYTPIVVDTKDRLDNITYEEREQFLKDYIEEVMKEIEIVPVSADEFYTKRNPYK